MSPTRKIWASKPVRVTLKGIWRQFKKCSYTYQPLLHELFVPAENRSVASACLVSETSKAPKVWQSFKEAYQDHFKDGWEEWHGPRNGDFFGRFYGCGDALKEYQRLADSTNLVMREIDDTLPHDGSEGWTRILHDLAHGFPTPLLRSEFTVWEDRQIDDLSSDQIHEWCSEPEKGGVPYPLHPFHWKLTHDVVTSSMAAIEVILDDEGALLVGDASWGISFSFPREIEDETEDEIEGEIEDEETAELGPPPVTGRVRKFEFDGTWHLEFDTGKGIEKATFSKSKGLSIYEVLLKQPEKFFSAGELLVKVGQVKGFEEGSKADYTYDCKEKKELRTRIDEVKKEIDDTVNVERLQELEEELSQLKNQWASDVSHFGRSKKLNDPEERRKMQVKSQIFRARQKIAIHMPRFGEYLRVTVKVVGGDFSYHPI